MFLLFALAVVATPATASTKPADKPLVLKLDTKLSSPAATRQRLVLPPAPQSTSTQKGR